MVNTERGAPISFRAGSGKGWRWRGRLVKRPKVMLLDEPLSALDAKLREAMQLELANLQEDVGITFVIVTHDQDEALSMADRIAVMSAGEVQQVGTPGADL